MMAWTEGRGGAADVAAGVHFKEAAVRGHG